MIICDRCEKNKADRRVASVYAHLVPVPGLTSDDPAGSLTDPNQSPCDLCLACWERLSRVVTGFLNETLPRAAK